MAVVPRFYFYLESCMQCSDGNECLKHVVARSPETGRAFHRGDGVVGMPYNKGGLVLEEFQLIIVARPLYQSSNSSVN